MAIGQHWHNQGRLEYICSAFFLIGETETVTGSGHIEICLFDEALLPWDQTLHSA